MAVEITVLILFVLLSICIYYVKFKYSYWSRRNVPFIEPQFPHGNFKEVGRKPTATISSEQYNLMKDKGRFFGMFFFLQPIVVITDLALIKAILIKDFNFFPDRGVYFNSKDDPMSAHLFAIEGNKWRSLRTRLTPTFTSGKMKLMFPTLKVVGDNLAEFMVKSVGSGKELEVKEYLAKFTTDVIGSCAFGIECNSFQDPNSEFRRCGKRVFENPRNSAMLTLVLRLFPNFGQRLRFKVLDNDAAGFFYKLVQDTVAFRQRNLIDRKDFLNLLLELKNEGVDLSMDEIAAQSFIFFAAGFETSSSNQTYCLYELALNQDCQQKARECVLSAIEKHGGLTYEAVCDMPYLDQCINETLRLYPSVPVLERKVFQDYRIPDSDVVLPAGMKINIPVYAIQHDEQYYPDPQVFDPDRFRPEETAKRHVSTFLPFGEGPRICIGLRFGILQSRVGLATMLSKFRFSTCTRTDIPMDLSTKTIFLLPKEGLWLKVEPL